MREKRIVTEEYPVIEVYSPQTIQRSNLPEINLKEEQSKKLKNITTKEIRKILDGPDIITRQSDFSYIKREFLYPSLADKNDSPDLYKKQKKDLNLWTDYLMSDDTDYPSWFRARALSALIKTGEMNRGNTEVFPELNKEALSYTYDFLFEHQLTGKYTRASDLSDIYSLNLSKVKLAAMEPKEQNNTGYWTKFEGSDYYSVYCKYIQNYGTGWDIAGQQVLKNELKYNDFYIYFSKNEQGRYLIPRIFVKTKEEKVINIGGVADYQNLEPYMFGPVKNLIRELSVSEDIDKKCENQHKLTRLIGKDRRGSNLSKKSLRFLYEIDEKIDSFGWVKDPRIDEFISKRNPKEDLAFVFDCNPEQVSTTTKEALKGGIKCHYGDLEINDVVPNPNLEIPETIVGNFNAKKIETAKGFSLPKFVAGNVDLSRLMYAKNLVLPEFIRGNLYLNNIISIKDLNLDKEIKGSVYLPKISLQDKQRLQEKYSNLKIV